MEGDLRLREQMTPKIQQEETERTETEKKNSVSSVTSCSKNTHPLFEKASSLTERFIGTKAPA